MTVSSIKKQVPILDGLFTWPSAAPKLIAAKCKSCGTISFPKFWTRHKPDCERREVEEILLSTRGVLRSYTIFHYPPPSIFRIPPSQIPYGIGMVELQEGIIVLGLMTCDLKALKTGIDVEFYVDKLYEDEQGNDALTWKFRRVLTC